MIARLWPGRRHVFLVRAGQEPTYLGPTTDAAQARRHRADLALPYGAAANQIEVRWRAPRKGVSCA